jgi:3-carboxy-cis,cis-muconate cycloisomerase
MTDLKIVQSSLLGPLFATREMRMLHADRAMLGRMLTIEAALAHAEAAAGVIPGKAVGPISLACDPRRYDVETLGEAAANAGNIAIPLIKALTAEVAKRNTDAARYVHWGATSQDIIDTATVISIGEGVKLLDRDLKRAIKNFLTLARLYRKTPVAARTWLQHAVPMTFGLKLSRWAALLARTRANLLRSANEASVLQFGGAAGTLASFGKKGWKVARHLADRLDLALPDAPWHAERDRIANVGASLGILIEATGKIACDLALMMQTEVGEAFEPSAPDRGGSSTMPQKRNPTASAQILAAAKLAPGLVASLLSGMAQEHERALGGWQAEWIALPQLFLLASGAVMRTAEIAKGLEINPTQMRKNLDISHGLIMAEAVQMALAQKIGKPKAHKLIETASKRATKKKRDLFSAVLEIPEVVKLLPEKQLKNLFNPLAYLGSTDAIIESTLKEVRQSLEQPFSKRSS